jgi:hypothetical protein
MTTQASAPSATGQITIAAAAEKVYALVSDLPGMASHAEETVRCRWLDGASGPAVGARVQGRNSRSRLRKWSTISTVTDADLGKRFAFEVTYVGLPIARWQYDIAPTDGGCIVTETTWDRRGSVMKFAGSLVTGVWDRAGVNARNIATTLGRIKLAAESA